MKSRSQILFGSAALVLGVLLCLVAGCVQAPVSPQASGATNATDLPLLLTVPDVRQSEPYSCGAASLQAVLNYWGIDAREGVLMQELNTSEDAGTAPESIVRVARAHGLTAELKTNLTLADLKNALGNRTTVIIDCQAWSDESPKNLSWENDWEDGHYMVVIGMDEENIYFEDPSLLGSRGMIPRNEFVSRWHDYEGPGPFGVNTTPIYHAGIIISGTKPAEYPVFTHVD